MDTVICTYNGLFGNCTTNKEVIQKDTVILGYVGINSVLSRALKCKTTQVGFAGTHDLEMAKTRRVILEIARLGQ